MMKSTTGASREVVVALDDTLEYPPRGAAAAKRQ
jgi:hypothetical protein